MSMVVGGSTSTAGNDVVVDVRSGAITVVDVASSGATLVDVSTLAGTVAVIAPCDVVADATDTRERWRGRSTPTATTPIRTSASAQIRTTRVSRAWAQ